MSNQSQINERHAGGDRPWPWVSDEARREVRHMEDFLVRCVVADHASEYSPDEAHDIVTRVLRHATHEAGEGRGRGFRGVTSCHSLTLVHSLLDSKKEAASLPG